MSDEIEPALQAELDALNAEWDAITAKRKAWMDAHMADFAKYPIGTTLYNRYPEPGAWSDLLGVVTGYYRYHANDPRFDRDMSVSCYVKSPSGFTDNTSRLSGFVESAEERADRLASEAAYLRAKPVTATSSP